MRIHLNFIVSLCLGLVGVASASANLTLPKTIVASTYALDDTKSKAKEINHPFRWEKTSNKAFKEAKECDAPVAILFTGTSWCGYCQKLEKEVLKKPVFKDGMKGVAVGLMCIAESPNKFKSKDAEKLAQKYGVSGYPTLVIVAPDGTEIGRMVGYTPGTDPEAYVSQIKEKAGK